MYVFKLNKYLVLYSCTNNCVECLGFLTQSLSDKEEQLWVWEYEADDGKHDLYMDIDEEIRFRVIKETFVDTSPTSGMLYMNMHLTTTIYIETSSSINHLCMHFVSHIAT